VGPRTTEAASATADALIIDPEGHPTQRPSQHRVHAMTSDAEVRLTGKYIGRQQLPQNMQNDSLMC
jgi:hypothetical protein